MALQITIAGVDKTALIDWASIRVSQMLTKSADRMSFQIKNYGTKTYTPTQGQEVIFLDGATRVFAGNIIQLNKTANGLKLNTEVVVRDYSNLLDGQLVSKVYDNMTASAIITDLLTTFTDGTFTTVNVNVNATAIVDHVVFNYISVSECMKKIVNLLSGYEWYVDYSKDIHFFPIGTILSPFNLTDISANVLINTLELKSDNSQIANDIIVRGGKIVGSSTRTEYQTGDGTRTNFPLANDFFSLPTVVVSSVSKTVGIDGEDADASFQFMWNQNSQLVRSTAGNTVGAGTNNIVIAGIPRFPLIYRKENQSSITLYGRKQKIINDKTIVDVDTASKRAGAELNSYALPTGSGSFVTENAGLIVGQYININSTIRNTNQNYKIQQISTSCKTPTVLKYTIQLQTANTVDINDVLNLLLIQNPSDSIDLADNTIVQRVSLFTETATVTDAIQTPTKSSPPYVYDTAKWNLSTWG